MSQANDNLTAIFNSKASNKEITNSLFGIDLLSFSDAHFSYVMFVIFKENIAQ